MIHRIEQLVDLNYKYAQYANMYIPKQNLNKTLKFEKRKERKKIAMTTMQIEQPGNTMIQHRL